MQVVETVNRIKSAEQIYIYGAGDVAKEVSFCLQQEPYHVNIAAYVISAEQVPDNQTIEGVPVISVRKMDISANALIIVAVLEKYRDEICATLAEMGAYNYILMTFESDLWCEIRQKCYASYRMQKEGVSYLELHDELQKCQGNDVTEVQNLRIYVARSHVDKLLKETVKNLPWEADIQVGASLTDERIAEQTDNTGDNISAKNRQYCELTAMYWMWKNCTEKYVGLCHYRRKFLLAEEDVIRLAKSDIDVAVTVPVVNVPNVLAMYDKNHIMADWLVMKQGIGRICPEYLSALEKVEQSNFYIPYNMFIMRRECFNNYCEWLFPILEYCESNCEAKEDRYQNRYIGFLAERLMSVYFEHHKEEMKVVFAPKHFIE